MSTQSTVLLICISITVFARANGELGEELKDFPGLHFDESGLQTHNILRSIHGSIDMKLDPQLSIEAERYARVLATLGHLRHDESRLESGENLACTCSSKKNYTLSAAQATKMWYDEVCDPGYTFGSKKEITGTGHFTQLLWNSTTLLGMGIANAEQNDMHCSYVVARYTPGGNMRDEYTRNVFKGSFTKDMCNKLNEVIKDKANALSGGSDHGHDNAKGSSTSVVDNGDNEITTDKENALSGGSDHGHDNAKGSSTSVVDNGDKTSGTNNGNNNGNVPKRKFSRFSLNGLHAHNKFRAIHVAIDMKIDRTLSEDAERYAKELVRIGRLKRAQLPSDIGENLAYSCSSSRKGLSAAEATKMWYAEVCTPGYRFGTEIWQPATLHFTQLVWNSTTLLGMGRANDMRNDMFCSYVVARYKKAGNKRRKFTRNVFKGSFTKDMCDNLDNVIAGIENRK